MPRCPRFLFAVLLLPMLAAAEAPTDLEAARLQSQYLIGQAYQRHPAIPAGLLESQAWVATRWQHRVPDENSSDQGMPPVYGLFGLYGTNDYGFVDLLGEVAAFNDLSKAELMADEAAYVEATAAWLEDQIVATGLAGQEIEAFRPVIETLSGISPASAAARYAVNSHVYEVYRTAGQGVSSGTLSLKPRRVDLGKVFTPAELDQLGAKELLFDVDGDDVELQKPKKKSASYGAGSSAVLSQINVDYPGATWNEAANWSSRDGTAITHVVIHTMQGSYAGSINWFLNPASQVSSHYLMRSSDGQITQMVRNRDKAWHVRSANPYTIGIEHEGFVDNPDWYTDVMYAESAKLTAYICNAYLVDCAKTYDGPSQDTVFELSNDYTVKGHQHYADQTHTDPGINWDWPRYYALVNGGVMPPDVNVLPEASFVSGCTGLACDFDASASSDADGAVTSYVWDFGDGETGRFVTASHTFAAAGSYEVKLTVTDNRLAVHEKTSIVMAQNVLSPPQKKSGGGSLSSWWLLLLLPGARRVGCGQWPASRRLRR